MPWFLAQVGTCLREEEEGGVEGDFLGGRWAGEVVECREG